MRYYVEIDGQERELDVSLTPEGEVIVRRGEELIDVQVRRVPSGLLLTIGDRVLDIAIGEAGAGALDLGLGALRARASIVSERNRARRREGGSASSSQELRSPMPGKVIAVLVEVGDVVEAGAPLVVVEAMKMENELRAPSSVEIRAIEVSPGQSVESGETLVRFA